jgi:hypothetical protein
MCNEKPLHTSKSIIMNEMAGACTRHEMKIAHYTVLVRKTNGKRTLVRPGRKWDNIKYLPKRNEKLWTGQMWLRRGNTEGHPKYSNEITGPETIGEVLDWTNDS